MDLDSRPIPDQKVTIIPDDISTTLKRPPHTATTTTTPIFTTITTTTTTSSSNQNIVHPSLASYHENSSICDNDDEDDDDDDSSSLSLCSDDDLIDILSYRCLIKSLSISSPHQSIVSSSLPPTPPIQIQKLVVSKGIIYIFGKFGAGDKIDVRCVDTLEWFESSIYSISPINLSPPSSTLNTCPTNNYMGSDWDGAVCPTKNRDGPKIFKDFLSNSKSSPNLKSEHSHPPSLNKFDLSTSPASELNSSSNKRINPFVSSNIGPMYRTGFSCVLSQMSSVQRSQTLDIPKPQIPRRMSDNMSKNSSSQSAYSNVPMSLNNECNFINTNIRHPSQPQNEGSEIYIFGGTDGIYTFNDVWRYSLGTGVWEEIKIKSKNIPLPRCGHTANIYNNYMYIFGGRSGRCRDIYKQKVQSCDGGADGDMDLETRNVETTSVLPTLSYSRMSNKKPAFLYSDIWRLDLSSYIWEDLTPKGEKKDINMYPKGREDHTATVIGDNIYVFGGLVATHGGTVGGARVLNDLWVLSLSNEGGAEFREVVSTSPPPPRQRHTAIVVENSLVVYGGDNGGGTDLFDMWEFKEKTNRWRNIKMDWDLSSFSDAFNKSYSPPFVESQIDKSEKGTSQSPKIGKAGIRKNKGGSRRDSKRGDGVEVRERGRHHLYDRLGLPSGLLGGVSLRCPLSFAALVNSPQKIPKEVLPKGKRHSISFPTYNNISNNNNYNNKYNNNYSCHGSSGTSGCNSGCNNDGVSRIHSSHYTSHNNFKGHPNHPSFTCDNSYPNKDYSLDRDRGEARRLSSCWSIKSPNLMMDTIKGRPRSPSQRAGESNFGPTSSSFNQFDRDGGSSILYITYTSTSLFLLRYKSPSTHSWFSTTRRMSKRTSLLEEHNRRLELELEKCRRSLTAQIIHSNLAKAKGEVDKKKLCIICCSVEVQYAFDPCGHACACECCTTKLLEASSPPKCPMCRTEVTHALRIHLS